MFSLLRFAHLVGVMLLLIGSLGAMRPAILTQFVVGTVFALAAALTVTIPRLYPWVAPTYNKSN
jgi:hypothetical protein